MGSERHLVLLLLLTVLFLMLAARLTFSPEAGDVCAIENRCTVVRFSAANVPALACSSSEAPWRVTARILDETNWKKRCSEERLCLSGEPTEGDLFVKIRQEGGSECSVERAPMPPRIAYALGRPIDLSRASEEDLVLLPGIGPARARAIVRHRENNGGIESLAELEEVRGIGPKTLSRLRGLAIGNRQ